MSDEKILVTLPKDIIEKLEALGENDSQKKEELIKEAVCKFLRERNITNCEEMMRNGYIQMAELNRCLAEDGLEDDCHCFEKYERMLECEKFAD